MERPPETANGSLLTYSLYAIQGAWPALCIQIFDFPKSIHSSMFDTSVKQSGLLHCNGN